MTLLGIISDVHGDVEALRSALGVLARMGVETVICPGDLVDYGPHPNEVIALIAEHGVICIRGNHDRWATSDSLIGSASAAEEALEAPVSDASREFLSALPTCWAATLEGVRIAMHHASVGSDMHSKDPSRARASDVREWLAHAEADVLVVGHSHHAFELRGAQGELVVNPGTLLRSEAALIPGRATERRTRPPGGGTFAVLEVPSLRYRVFDCRDGRERAIDVLFAQA